MTCRIIDGVVEARISVIDDLCSALEFDVQVVDGCTLSVRHFIPMPDTMVCTCVQLFCAGLKGELPVLDLALLKACTRFPLRQLSGFKRAL